MKRLLVFLLCVCLLISCVPVLSGSAVMTTYFTVNGANTTSISSTSVSVPVSGTIQFYGVPENPANKLFCGYKNNSGNYVKNGDTVTAGDVLTPYYIDFITDSTNASANFVISGAQVRVPVGDTTQGLRFIIKINTEGLKDALASLHPDNGTLTPKSATDTGIGYGAVIIPTQVIGASEIIKGQTYTYNSINYTAATLPAYRTYTINTTGKYLQYTAVLVGMATTKYNSSYSVRPYITYKDTLGNEHTVYGEAYGTTLYKVSDAAYRGTIETTEVKNFLLESILKVVNPDYGWTSGIYKP